MDNLSQFPQSAKTMAHWVCWRLEHRDGKPTKVPYSARNGRKAESNNPKTWSSFEDAVQRLSRDKRLSGVGFVFSEEDDLIGIDLDKCIDPETGEVNPWALHIIEMIDSYTELSPSGRGFHIWVRGKLPEGGRRKGQFEIYESGRYFTVTGQHWPGTPTEIRHRQDALNALHKEIFTTDKPANAPTKAVEMDNLPLDDRTLIEKACSAKNGIDFSALWNGDTGHYGDDHSAADMALASKLAFWTGKNIGQMDRLFRQSGLMRPKWDQRHYGDGRTYGQATLEKAATNCGEVYSAKKKPSNQTEPASDNLTEKVRRIAIETDNAIEADARLRTLAKEESATYSVLREQYRKFQKAREQQARENRARQALEARSAEFEAQENSPDDIVSRLNDRHAVVCYSNRVLIMSETIDPVLNRRSMAFVSASDFKLRYANKTVLTPGEKGFKETPWADYWLTHPERRQYEGIIFLPGETPAGYYNLWRGFAIQPVKGCCDRLREHVIEVLCAGDEDKFDYLWKWCAHMVQHPAELPETAIVMRSKEGTGKNTFVDALGKIFGRHYIPLTQTGQLCGRFTAHLMDAVLVFANEAVWGGDKQSEGTLKSIITDRETMIEAKGKDPLVFRNCKRLIAASNETWAVPRGVNDRRFFCLDVSHHRIKDGDYFAAIHQEMREGGVEALLYDLLAVDLEDWHPRHSMPGSNIDGEDIKLEGMSSVLKFWMHCLLTGQNTIEERDDMGRPYIGQPLWQTKIEKIALYDRYLDWCDRQRMPHRVNMIHFSRDLAEAVDFSTGRDWNGGKNRSRCYLFPELDVAREQFRQRIANVELDSCDD